MGEGFASVHVVVVVRGQLIALPHVLDVHLVVAVADVADSDSDGADRAATVAATCPKVEQMNTDFLSTNFKPT